MAREWTPLEILTLRRQIPATQMELAELLGVAFSTVNRWERGHTRPTPRSRRDLDKLEAMNGGAS